MIAATQLRPGMVVKFNNELHSVFSMVHRTPGNLRGFVQAKMRNLRSGSMIEHRFSSEDKVERVALDEHELAHLFYHLSFVDWVRDEGGPVVRD